MMYDRIKTLLLLDFFYKDSFNEKKVLWKGKGFL